MISANNVTLRVGKKALFEEVNIKFTEGNCYGLIGANGAGKSTFLKILSGQLEPTNGDVAITPGERLSFLQQDHFKYDEYPVLDTVIMGNARLYEIMKEKGLTDVKRVGLYGLTYKENVDDMRESPTLQLLESQERHLATGLKVYDPFITKDVVKNQYHDLDAFLADVDMVVVMVKHTEIRENVDKLAGKIVLDCHNIIDLPGVYHI